MTASIFIPPKVQYIDANGQPIVGGKVFTYETDMSTPKGSWVDYNQSALNTNPAILDSAGRASIWISGAYGIRITDANDVPVYTDNNVISYTSFDLSGLTATVDDLNSTTTSGINVTSNYTIQFSDRGKTILANATSGELSVTLPPIADVPNKWKICIKKIDFTVNNIILVTNASEKIDDVNDMHLYDYGDFVELLADGGEWRIVASQYRGAFVNITANTTIDLSYQDKTIFCDTASNSITITLPDIATVGNSFAITFKTGAVSGNQVIVNPSSPSTIDGSSSLLISEGYESYTIKSNLAKNKWYIVDSFLSNNSVTGDVKLTYQVNQSGWLIFGGDGWEIGNSASGGHYAGSSFHNLFILLYNVQSDAKCPVSGGRTGNSENDWNANKRLMLPKVGCRTVGICGTGAGVTPRNIGDNVGEENHVDIINEMPSHRHTDYIVEMQTAPAGNIAAGGGNNQTFLNIPYQGGNAGHNTMQPSHFLNGLIKL